MAKPLPFAAAQQLYQTAARANRIRLEATAQRSQGFPLTLFQSRKQRQMKTGMQAAIQNIPLKVSSETLFQNRFSLAGDYNYFETKSPGERISNLL